MDLRFLQEILKPFLEEKGLSLYDIKEGRLDGSLLISIFVDKKNGISIDELALVNDYVSQKLDEVDFMQGAYILEVSSPGAERDIRNLEELQEAKGKYIFVMQNGNKYLGDLVDVIDDKFILRVNLKGRFKNIEFKFSEIDKIHYSVKF